MIASFCKRNYFSANEKAAREFARKSFVEPSRMFLTPMLIGSLNESRSKEEKEKLEKELERRMEEVIARDPDKFNMSIIVHFVLTHSLTHSLQ